MIRLLTLKAAYLMDTVGNKEARTEIAAIKVAAPNIALKIIDRAIQVHGGGGVTDDFPLAMACAHLRTLRLADGPDEVHKRAIASQELRKYREGAAEVTQQVVGVDPGAVSRWLAQLGIEFEAPLHFQRIGLGQSNLTYRVADAAGQAWVLRRPPLGHLLASAHDVMREARIWRR